MAKVRAKTLTCPSCGSPVPVKNIFKAKVVVCGACDSQLDLSTPDFAVLGKLPQRQRPQDAICLGLQGQLEDGTQLEIIGRLRMSDFDDEDTWYWDEWLLLTATGEYLWLAEDEGKFTLLRPFTPEFPPDIDSLSGSALLSVDGERYAVRERGHPQVSYVEGELTWRAKVGDFVQFVDARGAKGGISVEFNDEEIEFFRREPLSRSQAYTLCGLDQLNQLEAGRRERRAELTAGPKALSSSGVILGIAAFLGMLIFFCGGSIGGTVGTESRNSLVSAQLIAGHDVAELALEAGSTYNLKIDALVMPATSKASFELIEPGGKTHRLLQLDNLQKTGKATYDETFRAERTGAHKVRISGSVNDITGTDQAAAAITSLDIRARSRPFNAVGLMCVAPTLLIFAILAFFTAATRTSVAYATAAREFRQRRRELLEQIHERHRVQGV